MDQAAGGEIFFMRFQERLFLILSLSFCFLGGADFFFAFITLVIR